MLVLVAHFLRHKFVKSTFWGMRDFCAKQRESSNSGKFADARTAKETARVVEFRKIRRRQDIPFPVSGYVFREQGTFEPTIPKGAVCSQA